MSAHPVQPTPSLLSEPFWKAVRDGVLLLQRCTTCAGWEWTPQMACSVCHTETLAWRETSGRGTLYSYSVVTRPQTPEFATPYVVAIVELEEGPRLLTDLVEVDPADVAIDMPVEVAFVGDGLYHFRPVTR